MNFDLRLAQALVTDEDLRRIGTKCVKAVREGRRVLLLGITPIVLLNIVEELQTRRVQDGPT